MQIETKSNSVISKIKELELKLEMMTKMYQEIDSQEQSATAVAMA